MEPRLGIEVDDVRALSTTAGHWQVTWRVSNQSDMPVALEAGWIPHGRFRGQGRQPLAEQLVGSGRAYLAFEVTASEPPGTIVENAFLILRARTADGQRWRIFARMTVEFDAAAAPLVRVEAVTLQGTGESVE